MADLIKKMYNFEMSIFRGSRDLQATKKLKKKTNKKKLLHEV